MANQSILTGIRRLWEYMTVPSYGNVPINDIEEEHDPVKEFIERQSRGDAPDEVVSGADAFPKKPRSRAAKSQQPGSADTAPPPTGAAVEDSVADLSEPEGEVPVQVDDNLPVETESDVPQDVVTDEEKETEGEAQLSVDDTSPEETENEVSEMTVGEEHQEEKQVEGEQQEEEQEGEAQQGESDDLMDIFRSEKEIKEKDIIQEIIVDVDINDLLEETRELMAEINTRRYGKR